MRIGFPNVSTTNLPTPKSALGARVRWIRQTEAVLIIFEAAGVVHQLLETGLATHDTPFARVNPRQARRFYEGERLGRRWFKTNRERPAG